jgi:hypothetical protein
VPRPQFEKPVSLTVDEASIEAHQAAMESRYIKK